MSDFTDYLEEATDAMVKVITFMLSVLTGLIVFTLICLLVVLVAHIIFKGV